jgi:hypothetical protein
VLDKQNELNRADRPSAFGLNAAGVLEAWPNIQYQHNAES